MPANQYLDYNVDIVMCIDATGSMHAIINDVKANALSFYRKFVEEMETVKKTVEQLRIKVVVFRDYGCDSEPMVESKFFTLDDESTEFHDFVSRIEASGGGDGPENALEALAIAMKSDWVRTGTKRRHVIIMWTDAPALALGARASSPSYPSDMPADLAELHEWWEGQEMDSKAKRLILFAPDANPWSDMIDWERTFHQTFQAGKVFSDYDIEACICILFSSI